jgi:hypothetical protein
VIAGLSASLFGYLAGVLERRIRIDEFIYSCISHRSGYASFGQRHAMGTSQQHDIDFYQWTQEQAALLRTMSRDSCPLDLDNLAEEIEDMGRDEIRELSNLLRQTMTHLLKIVIDPNTASAAHWFDEIITFQGDAVLAFSPGLKQRIDLEKIWRVACNGATRSLEKHGVAVPLLPENCPLSLDDLLGPEFDPDKAAKSLDAAIQATTPGRGGRS